MNVSSISLQFKTIFSHQTNPLWRKADQKQQQYYSEAIRTELSTLSIDGNNTVPPLSLLSSILVLQGKIYTRSSTRPLPGRVALVRWMTHTTAVLCYIGPAQIASWSERDYIKCPIIYQGPGGASCCNRVALCSLRAWALLPRMKTWTPRE